MESVKTTAKCSTPTPRERACSGCGDALGKIALCRGCAEDYGNDCALDDESEASTLVADWVDRAKALGRLTPETIAAFEECLEDIR